MELQIPKTTQTHPQTFCSSPAPVMDNFYRSIFEAKLKLPCSCKLKTAAKENPDFFRAELLWYDCAVGPLFCARCSRCTHFGVVVTVIGLSAKSAYQAAVQTFESLNSNFLD